MMFIAHQIQKKDEITYRRYRSFLNIPMLKTCLLSLFIFLIFMPAAVRGETYRISAGGTIRVISWPVEDKMYLEVVNETSEYRRIRSRVRRFDLNEMEVGQVFFSQSDFLDWKAMVESLKKGKTPEVKRIMQLFKDEKKTYLDGYNADNEIDTGTRKLIVESLDDLIERRDLYDRKSFNESLLNDKAKALIDLGINNLDQEQIHSLNRYLIESAFPGIIAKSRTTRDTMKEVSKDKMYYLDPDNKRINSYDFKTGDFVVEESGEVLLKQKLEFKVDMPGNYAIEGRPRKYWIITPIFNRKDMFLFYFYGRHLSSFTLLTYSFEKKESRTFNDFIKVVNYSYPYVFDYNEGNYFYDELEIFSFNPFDEGKTVIYEHKADKECRLSKVRARNGVLYFAVSQEKTLYCHTLYTLFSYDIKTRSLKKLHSDIDDFILSKNLIALREFKITNPSNSDGIHTLKIFDKDGKQLLSREVDDQVDYIISPSEDKIAVIKPADLEYQYLVTIIDIPGR